MRFQLKSITFASDLLWVIHMRKNEPLINYKWLIMERNEDVNFSSKKQMI